MTPSELYGGRRRAVRRDLSRELKAMRTAVERPDRPKPKVEVVNRQPTRTSQTPSGGPEPAPKGEGLAARLRAAGVETARWERNGSRWELTVAETERTRAAEILTNLAEE